MLFKVKKSGEKMPVCSPYCMGSFGSEGIQLFSVSLALSLSLLLACLLAWGVGAAVKPLARGPTSLPSNRAQIGLLAGPKSAAPVLQ